MKPHRARVLAMQALFQLEFQERSPAEIFSFDWIDYQPPLEESKMATEIIRGVLKHKETIDAAIKRHSTNWDIERISRVSRAILRIGMAQLLMHQTPPKVIIDESVKLAKVYAEDDAGKFINGILDAYWNLDLSKNFPAHNEVKNGYGK